VRSASKEVANAPDLIVNLRDGFCADGDFGRYVRMVRTHGALGNRATMGLLATTHTALPASVRSSEILPLVGLAADTLFRRSLALAPHDAHALADSLMTAPARVPTGRDDDSPDATFLRRVKPLVASAGYFNAGTMRALFAAVPNGVVRGEPSSAASANRTSAGPASASRVRRTRDALAASRIVDGVRGNVDALWAATGGVPSGASAAESRSLSATLDRTTAQLKQIPDLAPLATLRDIWAPRTRSRTPATPPRAAGSAEPLRQLAMAAWTVPYFVNAVLDAPESDSLDDPRDRAFAQQWHAGARDSARAHPERWFADSTLAPRLFAQVFAERKLLRRVETAAIPRVYDAPLPDVAVLYVPGIFGELFDDEIWQRGLAALHDQLGLRIVPANTDGRCSAADNASRVLQAMRDDTERRLARGYAQPRYLVVGYSKGGVDAAEALARDTALTRAQVAALVTMASPHGGTPVAERTDLSDELLRFAIAKPRPPTCDSTRAVESLWPATRAAFWSGPGRALQGLVPLVSVSLASEMQDAHPWMKITKRIARFSESNDGVVARSASRIPAAVASIDLGEVAGDHLAARAASDFPQESMLEALVLTLGELGVLEPDAPARWHAAIAATMRAVVATNTPHAAVSASPRTGSQDGRLSRVPMSLPGHIGWRADRTYKMSNLEALAERPIPEFQPAAYPDGIALTCDQDDMAAFREEYEFLYDAGNGGSENDLGNGFAMVETDSSGSGSGRACRLRTHRSAMKMTTASLRFRPDAFSMLDVRLRVAQSVQGVAPDRGGRGKNDATLKLWLVLRDERPDAKGKRLLFGYTWAARDASGHVPRADSLMEGGASRRRIGFSTLPEAWLVAVGGPDQEGQWLTVSRDLVSDLRRAYPAIPPEALRVVAFTVQTDSDESRGDTEVLLDRVTFRPRTTIAKRPPR
jgi:hypothetical protein